MSGDKVKRLRAVRKWLEKAENSYSSHKEITGEINLIMAQAEMERLKETHGNSKAETGIADGGTHCGFWRIPGAQCHLAGAGTVLRENGCPCAGGTGKETVPAVKQEETEPSPMAAETVETAAPVVQEPVYTAPEEPAPQPVVSQPVVPAPQPVVDTPPVRMAAAVSPKSALSDKEIQSVVGEAGRALRGQG